MKPQHVPFRMFALEQRTAGRRLAALRIPRLHKEQRFNFPLQPVVREVLQYEPRIRVRAVVKCDEEPSLASPLYHNDLRSSELDLITLPVQT